MANESQFDFLYDMERVDFCGQGLHYLPNVRYGRENPRQYMDCIYKDGQDSYPVLIWVHGGAWHDEYNMPTYRPEPTLARLAQKGWFIACIEYRLAQHGPYPIQLHDCQCAVAYLREHAEEFHLDPDRFAIWGESAGAHLACMVGTNYTKIPKADVQAVIAWFAPSDLIAEHEMSLRTGQDDFVSELLGQKASECTEKAKEASPITYADGKMPPVLLMHGDVDDLVEYEQSVRYLEKLQAAGNDARLITVKGQGHGFFKGQQYYDAVVDYLAEKLG